MTAVWNAERGFVWENPSGISQGYTVVFIRPSLERLDEKVTVCTLKKRTMSAQT